MHRYYHSQLYAPIYITSQIFITTIRAKAKRRGRIAIFSRRASELNLLLPSVELSNSLVASEAIKTATPSPATIAACVNITTVVVVVVVTVVIIIPTLTRH